ncbi:MAG: hypothetical protein J2P32_02365 [Actinobacteria bacterium]|nr:hypothetical protein [Actinomycetota bacterium]
MLPLAEMSMVAVNDVTRLAWLAASDRAWLADVAVAGVVPPAVPVPAVPPAPPEHPATASTAAHATVTIAERERTGETEYIR